MIEIQFRKEEFTARELWILEQVAKGADTGYAGLILEFIMIRATTTLDANELCRIPGSTLARLFQAAIESGMQSTRDAMAQVGREMAAKFTGGIAAEPTPQATETTSPEDDIFDQVARDGLEL